MAQDKRKEKTDQVYTGVAATLEAAVQAAHKKVPPPPRGKDFTVSEVVAWGMQFGGFTQQTQFWIELIESKGPLRPDG